VVASEDMRLCHMNGESVVHVIYCDDCLKAKFLDYYHIKILLLLVLKPGLRLFGDLHEKFPESFGGKVVAG
jgi:hypothetical protein